MQAVDIPGWKWTPIAQTKVGDIVAYWGNEEVVWGNEYTVTEIMKAGNGWFVTMLDGLSNQETTILYDLTGELLVKQSDQI